MTDSASSLSYPHTNELVNLSIKDWVYASAGREDSQSFLVLGRYGAFGVDFDFRKSLHTVTRVTRAFRSRPTPDMIWGFVGKHQVYVGTSINWVNLAKLDVEKFKTVGASPCKFSPTDL